MNSSKNEFLVSDLIIDDEYGAIESDVTVEDAAKKMKELSIPDLVVLEKDTEKVLGVVADFDIVQNVVAEGKTPGTEKVTTAMFMIEPVNLETTVSEAFSRMQQLNVNIVPVVENGKLIGVCSIQDCWSYIPDKIVDEIGLIPISDTKNAEFWFASASSVLAFVLGILLPLAGFYGFFLANQEAVMSMLGMAGIRGGIVNFSMFDARGVDFYVPLTNFVARGGAIWIMVILFSVLVLIFGILGLFSLIYTSYSDARLKKTSPLPRLIIPWLLVIFMVFLWIFYGIALLPIAAPVNVLGLAMSILSMILFIAAINRNYIFRQKKETDSTEKGVTD